MKKFEDLPTKKKVCILHIFNILLIVLCLLVFAYILFFLGSNYFPYVEKHQDVFQYGLVCGVFYPLLISFSFHIIDNFYSNLHEIKELKKDTVFSEDISDDMKDFILQHRLCDESSIINLYKDKSGE